MVMKVSLFLVFIISSLISAEKTAYSGSCSGSSLIIDGVLSEPLWQKAHVLEEFVFPWENNTGTAQTEVRIFNTVSGIFIGAVMTDTSIVSSSEYGEDIFELHFGPDVNNPEFFYVIETDPQYNTRNHIRVSDSLGENKYPAVDWDISSIDCEISINGSLNNTTDRDSSWTVEMYIPYTAFTQWPGFKTWQGGNIYTNPPTTWEDANPPEPADIWGFNASRTNAHEDFSKNVYSIWNHSGNYPYDGSPHFHDHLNFGTLLFTEEISIESASYTNRAAESGLSLTGANPFNPSVSLFFSSASYDRTEGPLMHIYSPGGRLVETVGASSGNAEKGYYYFWDASGRASGIYNAVIENGGSLYSRKIHFLK
ncbi:MAG: carbohydrate-binding family 9-like protein [Fibrobacterota bacterium]